LLIPILKLDIFERMEFTELGSVCNTDLRSMEPKFLFDLKIFKLQQGVG